MASTERFWKALPGRIALAIVPWLILIGIAVIWIDQAWSMVCPFDFPATDGPYQVYDAVRRIEAGQFPGRDFPAFHGVGFPWLFAGLCRLFGSGILHSELWRQAFTPLATLAVYAAASITLTRSLWPAVIWALLSLPGVPPVVSQFIPLNRISDPGFSMYGLRGLAPVLAITLIWRGGWFAAGAALAAAWLFGVEQGVYLAVAIAVTGITVGILRWRKKPAIDGPAIGQTLMVGIALALGLLALATGGGQANALRYYFVDIPADQIWYFGVPPNDFLGTGEPDNHRRVIYVIVAAVTLVIGWLAAMVLARRAEEESRLRGSVVLAIALGYSLFTLSSSLGIFRHEFWYLASRVLIILGTAWVYRRIIELIGEQSRVSFTVGLIAIPAVVALALLDVRYAAERWNARATPALSESWNQLATNFPAEIRKTNPEPRTGDLWSTYASIVEERLGVFHPREDYIIHALGERRAAYIADFAKMQPKFVQTMRRDTMKYEEWLQTTTWGFYERVLDNYEVVAVSPFSLLWRRTERQWREPSDDAGKALALDAGASKIAVPADATADLAIVRVEYEAIMPWASLPLLGQQPRFLVAMPGSQSRYPASLPPRTRVHEFPVPLTAGQPFSLEFQIRGWHPDAELRIKSVSVRYRKMAEANRAFLQPQLKVMS